VRLAANVVCCKVSAAGVHRSRTERDVSESDREVSIMRRPWRTVVCCAMVSARGDPRITTFVSLSIVNCLLRLHWRGSVCTVVSVKIV
jgi:hypothetical protein